MPLVYEELRKLAAAKMVTENPGHSLDATELVHEAYLRLTGKQSFESRSHFMRAAAERMRRILIDHARARNAAKRGGGKRVAFAAELVPAEEPDADLEALRACTLASESVKEAALPGQKAEGEFKQSGKAFWSLTEQGALAYRAGRYDEAAALLEQSLAADRRPGRAVLNWLWLSLVERRRGKPGQARAWLEKATKYLEQYPGAFPVKKAESMGLHLHNWLEAQVLCRKTEALLAPKK